MSQNKNKTDNSDDQNPDDDDLDLKERIWQVIFRHDTPTSKLFDVILLILIGISVLVIMLDSVESIHIKHAKLFFVIEWAFTILFTIEFLVRLWVARRPLRYMRSFFGVVDLLSILPTYISLLFAGTQYLIVVRILRLLRMFRVLKMVRHVSEANVLVNALVASRSKIAVFIFAVLAITAVLGTLMYVVEGEFYGNPNFSSIPESIYWAIVTISTVGYGDVTPVSPLGKMITTVIILLGYGTLAVPTGIVSAELNLQIAKIRMDKRECNSCQAKGHDPKASHCKMCGEKLKT